MLWLIQAFDPSPFVVFPLSINFCIKAGTSEKGACSKCGAPWVRITDGWEPSCTCKTQEITPCLVLDPFSGSGTTLMMAARLGRDYVGIELNPEYVKLIGERVRPAEEYKTQHSLYELIAELPQE